MITFNRAIEELLMTGQITPEVAKMYARGESVTLTALNIKRLVI